VVKHIQRTFLNGQDIAECLRQEAIVAIPTPVRGVSKLTVQEERHFEQKSYDIIFFQSECQVYAERQLTLQQNGPKAFALIMTQFCTKTMRQRIKNRKDYNSTDDNVKIHNNPIELLKAIKILIHDPITSNYPYALLTSALSRFQTCKQHENEPLLDYVKRFKQQRDIIKTTIGTDVLNDFVEHTEEYRNETVQEKKDELKEQAFERWCAYILIRNSNMSKYGSALASLASQFSLNNDQYPRTMTMASDFLNAH
jgi:hypothetical protein